MAIVIKEFTPFPNPFNPSHIVYATLGCLSQLVFCKNISKKWIF